MSENSEPLTTDEPPPEISHKRILVEMAVVAIAGALIGFIFLSASVGVGVLIGGILSFVNYYWQKRSIKAIFDRAIEGHGSRFLGARYFLRYVVLGATLTLIYLTQTVSIFAVIFGLSSMAIAVVIEGFRSIFFTSSDRRES